MSCRKVWIISLITLVVVSFGGARTHGGVTTSTESASYQWRVLSTIAKATDARSLSLDVKRLGELDVDSKRLLEARLYKLTGKLPSKCSLSYLIPGNEVDFTRLYMLSGIATIRAEDGLLSAAEGHAISLAVDDYFDMLPKVVLAHRGLLKKWVRMRWWATGHADIAEDVDGWDVHLRSALGADYDTMLTTVARENRAIQKSKT